MPFSFDETAPAAARRIYASAVKKAEKAGMAPDKAHAKALRMTQLAGWRKGQKGWKQVHSDIREKVNVATAVLQPDGRYMIENVPVFYPNAVKQDLPFTAADIREMIDNTNRGIENGGQKPALIEGHTNDLQRMAGIQPDAHGGGVNWREIPDKPGWAACDLVDVEPEYVERLQKNKLTGLSALIACDAGGLNRRFGHVALLGGSPQALSHLPATEVFSAGGEIAFSADSEYFPTRKTNMLSQKAKAAFSALNTAYQAYAAAEASKEAGEPEHEKKMEAAYSAYKVAHEKYAAETGEDFPPPVPAAELPKEHGESERQNMPVFENEHEGETARHTPTHEDDGQEPMCPEGHTESESDTKEGTTPMPGHAYSADENLPDVAAFEADPAGAFGKAIAVIGRLQQANKTYAVQLAAEKGRRARAAYDAQVEGLRKTGRVIPKEMADTNFELAFAAEEPQKAIAKIIENFKKLPVGQTPATAGVAFNAEEAGRNVAKKPVKVTKQEIRRALGQNNLPEEDFAYAALGMSLTDE